MEVSPFDNVFAVLQQEATKNNIQDHLKKEVREYEAQIIDYVVDRWRHGKGVNGDVIGKYQNEDYAIFKHQQNPLAGFGNVDLMLNEDLKNGLFLEERSNMFIIKSRDKKYQMLANKYGEEEFGITTQQMTEIIAEIKQNVLETIITNGYGK